jgi:hypothetical protein
VEYKADFASTEAYTLLQIWRDNCFLGIESILLPVGQYQGEQGYAQQISQAKALPIKRQLMIPHFSRPAAW